MTAIVLVVDDLLPNVKLLEVKLTSEYYEVVTARSGAEAIEIANQRPIDIILLDVMMPDMDGFETCRKLKSSEKTANIPVVMVTALSETEDRVQGLEAGADDFLTKPINDTALFARIKSLARMKVMLDELRLRDKTGNQLDSMASGVSFNAKDVSGARILIIDDDLVQTKHIFSKLSIIKDSVIETLADSTKAIEKMLAENYDLVIISTQLNNADGLRLCSHIRSQEKLRNLPLLILVEENDTKILIKGLELGVNDYLVTPIEGDEVMARVNTQIKRKRYQDALKSTHQQNFNMSITDPLTNLYNRRYFDVHCKSLTEEAIATNKPLILLITDIDHFKSVNDTYGHVAGDEILKQVSARLTTSTRPTDLVARFGGEEFVMVMPNTDLKAAHIIAERIRSSIEDTPFIISAGEGFLKKTTSIGVTKFIPGEAIEDMLKRADKGLYQAKESGRNKVIIVE
jgi:two-component system cell cycle response regulator